MVHFTPWISLSNTIFAKSVCKTRRGINLLSKTNWFHFQQIAAKPEYTSEAPVVEQRVRDENMMGSWHFVVFYNSLSSHFLILIRCHALDAIPCICNLNYCFFAFIMTILFYIVTFYQHKIFINTLNIFFFEKANIIISFHWLLVIQI